MSTNTIDAEKTPGTSAPQAKRKHTAPKEAKPPRRRRASPRKAAGNRGRSETNKKAEVIALMKRARGATLAETVATTDWQKHTVRGFVSILGSKGGRRSNRPRVMLGSARTRSPSSSTSAQPNATGARQGRPDARMSKAEYASGMAGVGAHARTVASETDALGPLWCALSGRPRC